MPVNINVGHTTWRYNAIPGTKLVVSGVYANNVDKGVAKITKIKVMEQIILLLILEIY